VKCSKHNDKFPFSLTRLSHMYIYATVTRIGIFTDFVLNEMGFLMLHLPNELWHVVV